MIVFTASLGLLIYVILGYPVLLALVARFVSRPIKKEFVPKALTVVVPVRNGARWIEAKIDSILSSDYPPDLVNMLVVSDGSTDETNDIVKSFPDSRVQLLALPPSGKAPAVSRGLERATGEIVVLTDVRQTFDPQALRNLVACFADPSVGVVTGELIIREGLSSEEFNTGLYWRYEKWIRDNLNRVDAMLGASGSIYAVRRNLTVPIPPGVLLDDVFLPFAIGLRGFRIYFDREARAYDFPTPLRSEFWRKVRTQAGVYQTLLHFPNLLWPGNRRFIYFLSHKVGRLLLPFLLIVVAISSFWLPAPWRTLALAGQILFYALAVADFVVPERNPLKRLSSPARTFVVLVASAACGLAVFFLPAQTLWKETKVGTVRPSDQSLT